MRDLTVRILHAAAVVTSFALVLEGPDLLLIALEDARVWVPVGVLSGVVTLPVVSRWGVGLVPPWAMPAYGAETPRWRVGLYHLVCCLVAAWLWTAPTLSAIAWVGSLRGAAPGSVGGGPPDVLTVAGGLAVAELAFFVPALVVFVRLASFRTAVDLYTTRASDVVRPSAAGIGSALVAAFAVSLLAHVAATAGVVRI